MGPKDLKKRKIVAGPKVEEVNFDDESRHEYLTGFHKRKVQRAKHAQENAMKRYKEEKRDARKKIREDRKRDFEQAMAEHKAVLKRMKEDAGDLGAMEGEKEEEDWEGFEEPPAVDYEAEYIDEDKYTTVTVEEMDASREGLLKAAKGEDEKGEEKKTYPVESTEDAKKKRKPRSAASEAARKKKRNFRYETKVERKQTMLKQRAVKSKKAKARKGAAE
ncbi:Nucleolar protein 12 [Penicillium fimorum]|uniref:Nucleolar protein 12 n=1 Tax=Penicillium fimorum TaxID=1882269 RepID=A0A9W9XPZ1_9EURO|nr:Nucleolar protein 12 [Penicillium fimorum]